MSQKNKFKIALAEDQILICQALALLVREFGDCEVIFTASDGFGVMEKVNKGLIPDILLLDLNMPQMDGYETTKWLHVNFPEIRVIMLTLYDSEVQLIRMLRAGANGFLKKNVLPEELHLAIKSVMKSNFYYNYSVTGKIVINSLNNIEVPGLKEISLSEQEIRFIQLACTELTYKEIGTDLGLVSRGVEKLRTEVCNKLAIKSRVGLAMYAIKNGLVML